MANYKGTPIKHTQIFYAHTMYQAPTTIGKNREVSERGRDPRILCIALLHLKERQDLVAETLGDDAVLRGAHLKALRYCILRL